MKYTEDQLREAARKTGHSGTMAYILDQAHKSRCPGTKGWRDEVLRKVAKSCGRSDALEKILAVIVSVADRDDMFTYGELEDYFKRGVFLGRPSPSEIRLNVDVIARDIEAHREKLLDGRTYRSAAGGYYQWDETGYVFRTFGDPGGILRDIPERPLELLP